MSDYEEPEDCELWGYLCRLTMSQVNQFRAYSKRTREHRRMTELDHMIGAYQHIGDVNSLQQCSREMCDLEIVMFDLAKEWVYKNVEGIPEGL